ncbi:hypothetical protein Pst134EB_020068 [Puccinia striiformis f. sp. tritici]|nr:hypothetical protein Pst134EB_020068 [Puccinia striiformis f. sp. tritici]
MVKASIQSLREDYPVDVIFQPDIRQIRANFADQLSRATNRYDRQNTLLLEGVHQMSARSVAVKQQTGEVNQQLDIVQEEVRLSRQHIEQVKKKFAPYPIGLINSTPDLLALRLPVVLISECPFRQTSFQPHSQSCSSHLPSPSPLQALLEDLQSQQS